MIAAGGGTSVEVSEPGGAPLETGLVCVWEQKIRSSRLQVAEASEKVLQVEFSPGSDALVAVNRSRVKVLDAKTGALRCETTRGSNRVAINWRTGIFTTLPNSFWDLRTGQETGIRGSIVNGSYAVFSPDGSTYCVDGLMYETDTWHRLPVELHAPGPGASVPLAFSRDGRFVSSGFALWGLPNPVPRWHHGAEGSEYPTGVLFSSDDLAVIRSDGNGRIEVLDSGTGRLLASIEAGTPVNAIALSPDGSLLASAGGPVGTPVKLWRHGTVAR